ncbi:MAG TPA: glycosyltransferase, partial [Abditibacteriaceae bacterium]|nr:glycosyltransferase [Abditibacteriaceae bacterium]
RSLLHEMDVLHVHHPFISGRLARRLRRDNQPILFTNHTRYDIYTHYVQQAVPRQMQSLTQPLTSPDTLGRRFAMRAARFANACDAVIAPSASMQDVLANWGVRAPVHVIPNGVDLKRFDGQSGASSTRNAWRARRQIAPDAPLAIYLGRLAPEKNGRVLLEALALSQQKIRGARLLIVGDGPSDEEWKEWTKQLGLQSFVHFAGALAASEVPQALCASDVFVSASVSEVHPLTLIEAMACGLPCVGTPSPGVQDTVCDGVNGWLALPEAAALGEALTDALGDETERRKRGAQAQRDSQKYSIEENADCVMQLYRAVLNRRLQSVVG